MENIQPQHESTERRVMSRIDAALRINYQLICEAAALDDPYAANFILPRYFLLQAELDQCDHALNAELSKLTEKDQHVAKILSLFNQKLNLFTGALYDSIVQSMLPESEQVNFSETGLSFYSREKISKGSYLHLTLSHAENFFHIAATAQVVYSELQDNGQYRNGAYFVTILPSDRAKLAQCIEQHGGI
ncbi:PilZ domain-containing protein [Acinetobacter sp.]|uniref:PilZ domain-containing protein n=1 Tax=Acinetobacter sp. TaxID=472 RepID=UPI00388EA7D3